MTIVGTVRLALLGAAAAGAAALPVSAQEAAISRCNALATDAERVACLTEALRATGVEPGAPAAPQPAVAAETAATQSVAPAAAPAPAPVPAASAATAAVVTTAATSTPEREREGWGLRVPFFGGRDDDEPAPAAMSAADAEDFGAEALQAREQAAPEVLMANVVSSEVVGYNQLQVSLDNGQIWRQTQADESWDPFLHDDPQSVQIRQTPMGGYRMKVDDLTKTLLVERVR